jgi:hypothetical protein
MKKTFRFIASEAADVDINVYHIRRLIGTGYHTAVPANGFYRWIDGFKIEHVKLFYVSPTLAAPGTVQLDWITGSYSETSRISATSLGLTPAVISCVPPRNSSSSFWCGPVDAALFHVIMPLNAIIELTISMTLLDNGGEYVSTTNTMIDSYFYIKPLDSTLGSSAGKLLPQGYPNVILI